MNWKWNAKLILMFLSFVGFESAWYYYHMRSRERVPATWIPAYNPITISPADRGHWTLVLCRGDERSHSNCRFIDGYRSLDECVQASRIVEERFHNNANIGDSYTWSCSEQ